MKKVISAILVFILIFSMVGCSKKSEDSSSIVGVWKYSYNEEYRELITDAITDPGVYVDIFYEFYADGTGKTYLSTDKNAMEFEYVYDGETLTIINSTGSFDTPAKLKGDILSVYAGNDEYFDMKRQ